MFCDTQVGNYYNKQRRRGFLFGFLFDIALHFMSYTVTKQSVLNL